VERNPALLGDESIIRRVTRKCDGAPADMASVVASSLLSGDGAVHSTSDSCRRDLPSF